MKETKESELAVFLMERLDDRQMKKEEKGVGWGVNSSQENYIVVYDY